MNLFSSNSTKRVIRNIEPTGSKISSNDGDSTRPNVGEDDTLGSPTRPNLGQDHQIPNPLLDPGRKDSKAALYIGATPETSQLDFISDEAGFHESVQSDSIYHHDHPKGSTSPKARPEKPPLIGDNIGKDPDFIRDRRISKESSVPRNITSHNKRLFDPQTDGPNVPPPQRKSRNLENAPRLGNHAATISRKSPLSTHPLDAAGRQPSQLNEPQFQNPVHTQDPNSQPKPLNASRISSQPGLIHIPPPLPQSVDTQMRVEESSRVELPTQDSDTCHQPELLLQPETRPISHDQLVVEVKGIYAGLVLVEAKCMDVDKKQSRAALERDPAVKGKLSDEQWQALIALHKTLLHEHHDFFLASQHPSANEALSQLAERYTMPARMWRHGIHAFLEVLRHRLPDSLEHMLAFIYIAYSMIALLYETVTTFEDTWIECLGDLGRYRMAIEDDDPRDREVWGGVARFWYGKAADKCPDIGRLYHHLAILARPFSLQQLALYAKALTCVTPFGSARSSIKTLFKPVVDGKESSKHRSNSFEVVFIKAHYYLFDFNRETFIEQLKNISGGLLDQYIGRATAKFKEQGVFAAITNIAALLEYGLCTEKTTPRSPIRRAFEDAEKHLQSSEAETPNATDLALDVNFTPPRPFFNSTRSVITPIERQNSIDVILLASQITFEIFSIALRRIGDKNVYPLVHVMFVFVWSLTDIPEAMEYVESDIPWGEMCSFLNTLISTDAVTKKVWAEHFPEPDTSEDHEVGRPLPEDYLMRGLMFTIRYFPHKWFTDAMVDDEERSLELPSMAAPRVERILWLGARIASVSCIGFVRRMCPAYCH